MADKRITLTVQHDLNREPVYKFNNVDIKTFDGVVELSGSVDTNQEKLRAEDIAKRAEGVAQVVNNITPKESAGLTPTGR